MLILQNEPVFNQKISYRCLRKHRKPFGLVHELGLHYREIYSSRYFLKHFTPPNYLFTRCTFIGHTKEVFFYLVISRYRTFVIVYCF